MLGVGSWATERSKPLKKRLKQRRIGVVRVMLDKSPACVRR